MQMWAIPSFFGTGRSGDDHGESDCLITRPSSTNFLIDSCSGGERGQPYFLIGFVSPTSMSCTHFCSGGKPTLSLKTEGNAFFTVHFRRSLKVSRTDGNVLMLPLIVWTESSSHTLVSWVQRRGSIPWDPICFGCRHQATLCNSFDIAGDFLVESGLRNSGIFFSGCWSSYASSSHLGFALCFLSQALPKSKSHQNWVLSSST